MSCRSCILLFLLAAFAAPALAVPPPPEARVAASLIPEVAAIEPGQPFTLAIVLTTQPPWHIYWKNPGDAGTATHFTFRLPPGFQADATAFPLPTRFVQPGDILAYGYSGSSVFLTRITPPKDLPAGENVTLTVEASWLCCKNICIPGGQKLTLTLPTAAAAQPAVEHQKLFTDARALLPAESPPPEVAAITTEGPPDPAGKEATLAALISWKETPAPQAVEVFPLPPDSLALSDISAQTQKNVTRVSLHARILAGQRLASTRLAVLVTYTDARAVRRGFYTDLDLHTLAAGSK